MLIRRMSIGFWVHTAWRISPRSRCIDEKDAEAVELDQGQDVEKEVEEQWWISPRSTCR